MTTVVAEIGSTHDGSVGIAHNSVRIAAACGAGAVKFQAHLAAAESTRNAPAPAFFQNESRFEYFERIAFTPATWRSLIDCAHAAGVTFVTSPFSAEAVALLEDVGVDQYKIASGEVTNLPLLEEVARTGKPVILSSGMTNWAELDAAVETIRRRHRRVTVLQCTSAYPCAYEQVGLNVMAEMRARYELPVGLSDHTAANYAAFAAAALGAVMIEKHFTLSRHLYGSDARHSSEPRQFKELVAGVRAIDTMLETPVDKDVLAGFEAMREVFQKSIVTTVEIPAGTVITAAMVGIKKPGTGLAPARLATVVGARARRAIPADTPLSEADLEACRGQT